MIDHIVIVGGPTSSGKSKAAIRLAQSIENRHQIKSAIINADSVQVYNALHILTNQPSPEDMNAISHYMYSVIEPNESMAVVDWNAQVTALIGNLQKQNILPIVVGGSGFYINSLINDIDQLPKISDEIRNSTREMLNTLGRDKFYKKLLDIDLETECRIRKSDTYRILRAYEVYQATGKSILSYWNANNSSHKMQSINFVMTVDRETRRNLIEQRISEIVKIGVLDEVKSYNEKFSQVHTQIRKALGYMEFTKHLDGEISLENAMELTAIATKQYAKRQVTWFKNKLQDKIEVDVAAYAKYQDIIGYMTDCYERYAESAVNKDYI